MGDLLGALGTVWEVSWELGVFGESCVSGEAVEGSEMLLERILAAIYGLFGATSAIDKTRVGSDVTKLGCRHPPKHLS